MMAALVCSGFRSGPPGRDRSACSLTILAPAVVPGPNFGTTRERIEGAPSIRLGTR
jgi:hypothetical protein